LIIALAWMLRFEQVSNSISGALPAETNCGNNVCEAGEDYNDCPEDCIHSICGNNVTEEDEECDGIDDALCPELCRSTCMCPPLALRNITTLPNRYTFSYSEINLNELLTINLGRPKVAFQSMNIIANKTLEDATFIVDSNALAPPDIPNGTIQSYFQVFMENSSQEQYLPYKEIFFRVPTSWTIKYNIKQVELEHADVAWQSVETKKLYQDMDYIYFAARPLELGLFAVLSPPIVIPESICGNGIVETNETADTCCADAGCPQNQSCISNECKYVAICGNNMCELSENATGCPGDCAIIKFRSSTAPALVLMLAVLAAILLFMYRKFPTLLRKKQPRIAKEHATPERWS